MKKVTGIIEKVYIPNTDTFDIMYAKNIGFIINVNEKLYKFVVEANEETANIMKNDEVVIYKELVNGETSTIIKKVED